MLRIQLMGDFRVWVEAQPIPDESWRLRKAAAIIKLLALTPGHTLLKEYLIEALWPEVPPAAATNNFRYALHKARKALAFPSTNTQQYLCSAQNRLWLAMDEPVQVDVGNFEAAISAAQLSGEAEDYRAALELYSGPLLAHDLYEDWTEPHRENLRLTFRNAALEFSTLYEQKGLYQQAITTLERLRIKDPLEEEVTLRLMRLYAAVGQPRFALEKYDTLCRTLQEELELEPSEPLRQLYQKIVADFEAPPVILNITPPRIMGNLPGPLSSFIGREVEVAEVGQLLKEHRLITITGMGGIGKTSLALAVTREVAVTYSGGAWLVELASVADSTLAAQRLATSLGIKLKADDRPQDLLIGWLSVRQVLLVLDNCEHLVDECARLVNLLLETCPQLQVLATSREVLGLEGEINYSLPLLPIPLTAETPDLALLQQFASVRLFVERAREQKPAFELNEENAVSIVRICQKLEGIPLALELAAARIGILSTAQIAAFMDESLLLLKTARREVPDRHSTLRGALDWSYRQLQVEEQKVFRVLAVFSGGASLEGITILFNQGATSKFEVLDTLARLAQKSLIFVETEGREARYRQLEVIRQYGWELVAECGELTRLRELHANYYLKLVEEAEEKLTGADQGMWLEKLEIENDNLRAALGWSVQNQPEVALRIGAALRRFWWSQGYISEGLDWLERALEVSRGKNISLSVRAAAQVAAGTLTSIQSNYEKAISFLEEALAIYRSLEDKDGMAKALGNLGMALGRQGKVDKAREVMQECLKLDRQREDLWGVAYDLSTLGDLAYYKKDLGEARAYFSEASRLYQALGDSHSTLICRANLAEVNRLMGDFSQSLVQHAAIMEVLQDSNSSNNSIIPGLLQPVAHLYLDIGDPGNSTLLLSSSATLSEQSGIGLNADARAEFDDIKEAARQLLSPEVFRAQWEQGRRLSGQQAVDYTLNQLVKTLKIWSTFSQVETKAGQELSDREKEVASLVAQGLSNREIAGRLGISKRTVDNHLHNVLTKLGAKSRAAILDALNPS